MSYALNNKKFLSDKEFEHLEALILRSYTSDGRNALALATLLNTGARASEILGVTKADLNPEKSAVFIKGLKGSRDREIPLPPNIFVRLNGIAADLKPADRVFPMALRTLQTTWHKYRPAPKGIKSLRHTFAIRLYKKTKDIRLVQMALGHRSILNTMVYADYVYNQTELQKLLL